MKYGVIITEDHNKYGDDAKKMTLKVDGENMMDLMIFCQTFLTCGEQMPSVYIYRTE